MSYQTGTLANINDVLSTFSAFLAAAGWTIESSWREPIAIAPPATAWRYAYRLSASKGNKHVALQDFYLTPSGSYGTAGVNKIGPGIALTAGLSSTPQTTHALAFYDSTGPVGPTFATDVGTPPGSAAGTLRTVIMPLPAVNSQAAGTWSGSAMAIADPTGAAPFGPPGGAPVPMKYWMFADAAGDNVLLVVLHDDPRAQIQKTTYLMFGDLVKAGPWADTGVYFGASHSCDFAFDSVDGLGHSIYRFGPPGAVADGQGCTFLVRVDVDTTVNKWPAICNVSGHPGTGRRLSSTGLIDPKPGDGGTLGVTGAAATFGKLRQRRSSVADSATGLPLQIFAERDSGLWSVVGRVPNIFQSKTDGFSFGTETLDRSGATIVVFDGFTVRKIP